MQVNLRDLLVLLECAKFTLKFVDGSLPFKRDDIANIADRVFNETVKINLTVQEAKNEGK